MSREIIFSIFVQLDGTRVNFEKGEKLVKGKTKKKLLTSMTIAATLATTTTAATTTASTTTTTTTTAKTMTTTATADASIMEKIDSLSGQPRDKFLFDPLRIFFAPLSRKKGFFIFLNSDGPFYNLVKCVIGTQISGKERQKANLRDRERMCACVCACLRESENEEIVGSDDIF